MAVLFLIYGQDLERRSKGLKFTACYESSRADPNQKERKNPLYPLDLRGTWGAQSAEHQTLDLGPGHDPRDMDGSALSREACLRFFLSHLPPLSPVRAVRALSLKIIKTKKKKN